MEVGRQVLAVVMSLALVASATVVVGARQAAAEPTEIAECGVIDEPGNYVLTQNLTRNTSGEERPVPCLSIRASDVTLDGDGHSVRAIGEEENYVGTAISVGADSTLRNVSIRDMTFVSDYQNVRYEDVVGGQLTNVSSKRPESGSDLGIIIRNSQEITVRESTLFTGARISGENTERIAIVNNTLSDDIVVEANESTVRNNVFIGETNGNLRITGSHNLVADNRFERGLYPTTTIEVAGRDSAVLNNSFDTPETAVTVTGRNHTIAGNDVEYRLPHVYTRGIDLEGYNHTVENNRITGDDIVGIDISGGAHEIAHNDVDIDSGDSTGILVGPLSGPVSVHHNTIDGYRVVHRKDPEVCVPNPESNTVNLHENTFIPYDGELWSGEPRGEHATVLNENDGTVINATNNYWGVADGPSSFQGRNVTDPVTGEPADGSGGEVSEGVHFDPWLDQPTNETGPTESND